MADVDKGAAMQKLAEIKKDAQKDMDDFQNVQKFEIASECLDKQGQPTKVLIIDTDTQGILGMFMENGQPLSFDLVGAAKEDKALLAEYMDFHVKY